MVTSRDGDPRSRDSQATRQRILDALGRVIVEGGLASVGVNALARAAGCDKVLIYRYFGDLDGLYAEFAEGYDFWWTVAELTAGLDAKGVAAVEALQTILRRHAEGLRRRPVTLAVLAAELSERTPLVVALEATRERRSIELMEWIGGRYAFPTGVDMAAIGMLLGVAVNYLAVRARSIRVMGGVKIRSDADWERLFAAIDRLIDGVVGDE